VSAKDSQKIGFFGFLGKLGAKLGTVAVKLIKVLKFGKLTLAGASVASYALVFTWQFAIVITSMLVVHEYGHLWTMKRLNMKTKGMYLIPFLGAAAVSEDEFPTRESEAIVAMAGPLTGAALAVLCGLLFLVTRNAYLAAIASWMALINLFNLIPVAPLDGGRVMKSVTMSVGSKLGMAVFIGGLALAAFLTVEGGLYIFAFLIPLGFIEFFFERREMKKDEEFLARVRENLPTYQPHKVYKPAMSKGRIKVAFASYVGLALFLWLFMLVMANEPGAGGAMQILKG